MKISLKNLLIKYICFFPLIHIAFYSALQGGYTNLFYTFTEILVVALSIKCYRISRKDALILLALVAYLPIAYFIHEYSGEIPIILNFIYFVAVALILNNERFKTSINEYIRNSELQITIVSIVYIFIVIITVITGSGLLKGWSTTTLKGPYGTPHTLAYELLVLVCLNLLILLKNIKPLNVIVTVVLVSMVLFTASRAALIGLIIILLFFVSRFGVSKMILIFITVAAIGTYLFLSTSILDPLLQKTELAISNGSVSNGRFWIFASSVNTFLSFAGVEKWFVGIGYDNLLEGNYQLIHNRIQAHNDILNAMIAFGIIFGLVFVYSIFRMAKGTRGFWIKTILLMALVNLNGLVSYMTFAVPVIVVMVYFESESVDRKKKDRRKARRKTQIR